MDRSYPEWTKHWDIRTAEHRWTHLASEELCYEYLSAFDLDVSYCARNSITHPVDLRAGNMTIDVKVGPRTVDPRPHYMGNINLNQLTARSIVDAFIFCSYNLKTNVATLMGIVPKFIFLETALLYAKGSKLENGQIAVDPMLSIRYADMESMSSAELYARLTGKYWSSMWQEKGEDLLKQLQRRAS